MTNWIRLVRKKSRTRRELQAMSDKELKDIGINRADINQIVKEIR